MLIWLILGVAGFVAGAINAIAGGGSLVSFPALLLTGMPAVAANATNTLAVWPGSVSSTWAYKDFIAKERRRAIVLGVPCLLGGLLGSWILLHTSEKVFRNIVPWLIFFACGLLLAQARVSKLVASKRGTADDHVPPGLWIMQFLISVYGGYFGAGIGILMLAAMGIFLPDAVQRANGLKVLFAGLINGIAAVYFLGVGAAWLPQAAVMAVTSIFGGWVGARVAQKLPARVFRAVVVAYGMVVGLKLLWDNYSRG